MICFFDLNPLFRLTNLNIGHNNISSLPCDTEHTFPTIVELNLIHNNISTFGDVADLAYTFPNLQTLVLSDNPLKSFGDDEQVRFTRFVTPVTS